MPSPTSLVVVTGRDGATSEMRSFTCEAPRAVVVIVPAMGVAARFYDRFAEALNQHDLQVFVTELRGIGSSSVRAKRGVAFGYHELVEDDLVRAVDEARARSGSLPIHVLGHSLGGHLAILFGGLHRDAVASSIVVAGGTPWFMNWPLPMRAKVLFGSTVMRGVGLALGHVPGDKLGFGGRESNGVVREWARFVRTNRLEPRGYDRAELARAMEASTIPLLGVSLEGDDWAPRISTDRLCEKLPNAQLTRIHMEQAEFAEKVDHFRWAKSPAPVARVVAEWISRVANSSPKR